MKGHVTNEGTLARVRVAILFTDGVGVGAPDPAVNPLARGSYLLSQFADGSGTTLPAGGRRHDVDTTFDVAGRPQSASNQTAIFTGLPAPKLIGEHVLGYPNAKLRALLADHSIVRSITGAGRTATFANAYPLAYLDALSLKHRAGTADALVIPEKYLRKIKASASTLAMAAGGVELRTLDDAHHDLGLTHDVDGHLASERVGAPQRSPADAAAIFWSLAADFTLFEHYLADEAGHAQDFAAAESAISIFDAFARAVVEAKPADTQLFIVSDHGNVEDLSSRSHTLNRVAVLTFGSAEFDALETVADVGLASLQVLGVAR